MDITKEWASKGGKRLTLVELLRCYLATHHPRDTVVVLETFCTEIFAFEDAVQGTQKYQELLVHAPLVSLWCHGQHVI